MAATISIDIHAVITALGKADGASVSAAELGVSLLTNAVAGTLPNGQRCIQSNGSAALIFRPEATATAAGRTDGHYAVRFNLRPVAAGAITPANTADFVRHHGTADPRFHVSVNETHVAFAARHGAAGGEVHQFLSSQNATDGRGIPYGESAEMVWIARRSGTAATDFVGLFADGTCVGAATNLQVAVSFNNSNMFSMPNTANLTWQIHGLLEVYSVDDYQAEGFLRSPEAGYQITQACGVATSFRFPGTSWTNSGFTLAEERQNVGTGINIADHATTLTGTTGSSNTLTWAPPVAPSFGDHGICHWEFSQVQAATASTIICGIRDAGGAFIVRVRLRDDAVDGTILDYRVGTGAWVTLDGSNFRLTSLHAIRITHRSDGRIWILIKDDTIINTSDGRVWSVVVETGETDPAADAQVVASTTSGSSVTLRRGHIQFYHRAIADVYTDSWSSGDAGGAPQNQVPNHIPPQWRGSRVGERFSPEAMSPTLALTPEIPVWGNVPFGRRGWSAENWVSVSPNLPDHVAGSLCYIGISAMNTMVQKKTAIDGGGAGAATALADTVDLYTDAVERLLVNRNWVWFLGFIPPPVSVPNSITQAQQDFVRNANDAIITALRAMVVPSGSRLILSDVLDYAEDLMEDPATDWTWDSSGIHLLTAYDARYAAYAIASAEEIENAPPVSGNRSRDRFGDVRGQMARGAR